MNPTDIESLNDAIKKLTKALKDSASPASSGTGARPRSGLDTDGSNITVESFQSKRLQDIDKERAKLEELENVRKLSLNQQLDLRHELEQKSAQLLAQGKELEEHEQNILDNLTAQGQEKADMIKAQKQSKKILNQATKEEEKVLRLQQKIREERQQAAAMTENMVHSFGAMLGMSAPKKGGIVDVIGALTSKDAETRGEAFAGLKSGLSSMFSPLNIATNLFQKLGELFIYAFTKGDEAAATFAKLTGHGRELAGASMEAAQALGPVNANIQELAQGAAAAQNALAGVAGRTRLQAAEFGGLTTNLERLGVSVGDFTTIASQQMVSFGATNEDVAKRMANMQAQASALGMSFGEFSSMAASTQSSFAAFGHNSEKVFLRSASVARQLGLELGKVVDLGEKFDTFDSAAETVADLNYIMGGPFLDSMELMALQASEGPEAVARKIKEQFQATGKSFVDMSYHQRKALAQSMNMTVDEVQKFMSGPLNDETTDAVEKATRPVDQLMQRANSTLTFMEQFARMMQGLALELARGIFGDALLEPAKAMKKVMEAIKSPDVINGVISVGKGLMVIAKGAAHIISGIGSMFDGVGNGLTSIVMTIAGTIGSFFKVGLKFLGPVFGLLEMGYDIMQSFGILADDKEQAMAKKRLTAGLAGAAAGGAAGSFIPGLGTLLGAGMGYSLAAGGAEAMSKFSLGTGPVPEGGAALVGEKGPEVVTIPTGASVIPNNAFARPGAPFANSGSPSASRDVTVHVKLDVNDRKFREMITLNTVDVIEGNAVALV